MKTYCFDLDGTLCTNTYGKYNEAIPFHDNINKLNNLFDEGNVIIIETARGASTNIDWTDLTSAQLEEWGVKYTKLRVGKKIEADIYIDDKAINALDFFNK